MICTICITLLMIIYVKYKKIKLTKKSTIDILLKILILANLPYLYLQGSMLMDKLYYVQVKSTMDAETLNLYSKEGYIGEKLEDSYIIYQENGDLKIPFTDIKIVSDEDEDIDFQRLYITSNNSMEFNSKLLEFLSHDYFYYDIIVKNNQIGEDQVQNVYYLKVNDMKLIKGGDE